MPTLTQLHLPFLIGILICVLMLTIAFHLQARSVKQAEDSPAPLTPPNFTDASLQPSSRGERSWNPSLALVPLFLVIIVGRWFTRTTYYDYFVIQALLWPLFGIGTTALFLGSLTSGVPFKAIEQPLSRAVMLIILLILTVALGWATFTILPNTMADFALALRDGPQLASGHLDSKNKIEGRGSVASIEVDSTHYTT